LKYTYTVWRKTNEGLARVNVCTRLENITVEDVTYPCYVNVFDNMTMKNHTILQSQDELESWQIGQERAAVWKPEGQELKKVISEFVGFKEKAIASAVNPKHHKAFIDEYEWVDAMSRIPRYRDNPEAFKGAIELQVRKYLDRNGRKDDELQELLKGLWYFKYLCAYIKVGCKPIMAVNVDKILNA
jgi:hypothetical protein